MAMHEGTLARGVTWPTSTVLAVIGAVAGVALAAAALLGAAANVAVAQVGLPSVVTGLAVVAAVVNIALAVLVFFTELFVDSGVARGALLIIWGVVGLVFGFGLWFGALLVLIAGFMNLTSGPARRPMLRGPAL